MPISRHPSATLRCRGADNRGCRSRFSAGGPRFSEPPLETRVPAPACRQAAPVPRSAPRIACDQIGRRGVLIEGAGLILLDPDPDQVARQMSCRFASPCSVSPARNSWTICRLNSMLWVRCLAMASILRKPGAPVNSGPSTCPAPGAHSNRGSKLHAAAHARYASRFFAQRRA